MARTENVVDDAQAYSLRMKNELGPCVERIAQINTYSQKQKTGYFFAETAKGCDMVTHYNEGAASPPGKH